MRALVKYAKSDKGVELREVETPSAGRSELLVKIIQAGICATDLHILRDSAPMKVEMPVVMGHEFIGEVVSLGEGVNNYDLGDRVVALTAARSCGECSHCRNGNPILCDEKKSFGSGVNGTMSEYMALPTSIAYKLPNDISKDERMILLEPMSCCAHAVYDISSIKAGDVVLITGLGTIGLLAMVLAKELGAYIIVSGLESDKERLQRAKELGADETAIAGDDLKSVLSKHGRGVDCVIECSGAKEAFYSGVKALKPKGEFIQMGFYSREFPVNFNDLLMKELVYKTSNSSTHTSWERVIKLAEQGLFDRRDIGSIVTDRLPLSDWKTAFDKAIKKEGYKTVLIP